MHKIRIFDISDVCLSLQPVSPTIPTSPIQEEEDEDLNKALGVQRFQQILSPTSREPNEHRQYNEEDFQCEYTNIAWEQKYTLQSHATPHATIQHY